MPPALELLSGRVTAPGTTFTALTVSTGNTFTVRAAKEGSFVVLLQVWTDVQAVGTLRIRSPNLHDNVQGIRLDTVAGDVVPLLPWGLAQALLSQDPLTVELTGSAVAADQELAAFLVYYSDLPGSDAVLQKWDQVVPRIINVFTVENTLALGTTGDYSGEEAINAEFDQGRANVEYALLGYFVDTECAAVRWRSPDTGNYGVGGPGEPGIRFLTKDWFLLLSQAYGLPLIPVFNWSNRAGILIDGLQDENGADTTVTSIFAELA